VDINKTKKGEMVMEKKKNLEFLLEYYAQMFNEKRYLDGRFARSISLYFTIITISVSIAAFAYNLATEQGTNIMTIFVGIFLLISIFGFYIVLSMRYNRVNYVKTVRQINAIRNYCLKDHEFEKHNLMKYSISKPPFYVRKSTQLKFMHLIVVINSFLGAISLYLFLSIYTSSMASIIMSIAVFVSSLLLQVYFILYSLKKEDIKEAKN